MKHYFDIGRRANIVAIVTFAFAMTLPLKALPASIALATEPLANATTTAVLPNLMFILDGSGSMDWNYLPDWVDDNLCKNTNGSYSLGCVNSPLFKSPDVNGVYYNPAINYLPPVDSAGTSYASQTSWASVKNDAYGIQSSSSTNLVTSYPDVEWCTSTSYSNCLRNDNYVLPGTVGVNNYTVQHTTTSNGNKLLAKMDSSGGITTELKTLGPHYYRIIPGEWCDSAKLINCQSNQSDVFSFPARVRWCLDDANAKADIPAANSCQGLRAGNYKQIRFPTKFLSPAQPYVPSVPAVGASATFRFSMAGCSGSKKAGIASITINGVSILPSATTNESSASSLAGSARGKTPPTGYSFSGSGDTLKIQVPATMGDVNYDVILTSTSSSNSSCTFSPMTQKLSGYVASKPEILASSPLYSGSFVRTDIVDGATYPRAAARTDCIASTTSCSYSEEMTNFANWWTYYQTRMQTMKTATSRAFKSIDNRYRVGFIDIQGNNYLPIAPFDAGTNNTKDKWYKKLFSINPANGTPLRSALARVGLLYAGKKPVGSADPMQYSCQQNFALLTTDGYWNTDANSDVKGLNGNAVGNLDGGSTPRPMYEGPTASSNSLADAAKYYYDTDLRNSSLGNCTGALGIDVCKDNVFVSGTDNNVKQHMTTFTLGLGVDGTLSYVSDYKTADSGDYYDIKHGSGTSAVNWPVPVADTETAIDDLWHAAVNGQGTYFSAKDPSQLTSGLNGALAAIGSKLGAGSAAATSTLNPVANDNFAYVASYTTVKWQGNLEARTINLKTGDVSESPAWCVENTIAGSCSAPGTIMQSTDGSSTAYYCVTPGATADTCVNGTLDGTSCKVEMATACTGTMRSRVGTSTDSRVIKMANGAGALVDFIYDNLSNTQKTYFSGTGLSQWADLSTDQKTLAAGEKMVSYLRGHTGFEMERTSNAVEDRLYRYREATLGDAIESQPAFVGKPYFKYADTDYAAYITAKTSRPKTVYMGANDGMLHAFDAVDGTERWAFVPTLMIPDLWHLADKNYASQHRNYVNGRPVIADVYDTATAAWRTILVAGLNGGGRGYYALDITNPIAPSLLWEINSSTEANLGYSYGYPVVTKKADGTWVVLFTSGYNNTSPGNGEGYLYVRNALTGAHIARIGTGAGDTTTPSGLAKISNYANDPTRNNTSLYVYGGDILGNVWRFNINNNTVLKLATLKDPSGAAQPVTAAPELGVAYGKRLVFVGTGKYLEKSDLENTQRQTLYAIKDDNLVTTLVNPRLSLVQQTLTTSGSTRTASQNEMDFRSDPGWFIDLSDSGERIHVEPILDSGLLIAPSTVPSNTVCSPGGYGWLNYFNYLNGNNADGLVSELFNAPIVGVNYYYTPDGKRHVSVVTSDHPTPEQPTHELPNPPSALSFKGKRVIWRELIPE
ncbi:pilus assembly protein [Herminiimonas sp. NPDC097707]|uniref:pilus assembly protein n=1 Tax=Herminiimonas sp. NPDC097707 TaxID=3364007 RepID=UPI00383AF4E8